MRWLLVTLLCSAALNGLLVLALIATGESRHAAWTATAPGYIQRLEYDTGLDSWRPMALAYQHHKDHPDRSLYDVFFVRNEKFQYPPSALLGMGLLPGWLYTDRASLEEGTALRGWLTACSLGLCALTILLALRLFSEAVKNQLGASASLGVGGALAGCALSVCYYPLLKGHTLGQIQVLIGVLLAAGLLLELKNRRAWAGLCFGLCVLVKPQYALVLLWSCLTRDWRFFVACLSVVLIGLAASVWTFGWADHVRYLDVLRYISLRGEVFWPNQSVNGLMNRLLGNGDAVRWTDTFAPYHPLVYSATLLSSASIIGAALWATRRTATDDDNRSVLDLSILVMASTMAAPVAWEHHYGVWLPVFAVVTPVLIQQRPAGRLTAALLLVSYLLIANVVLRPEAMNTGAMVLLGSHLFLGALTLFVLCLAARMARAAVPHGA